MKSVVKNKFTAWLIILLIVANMASLVFYWVGHLKHQRDHSPKEFLAAKLNFSKSQKKAYFDLARNHNDTAQKIRQQIKVDKDVFFQLLQSDSIIDSARNRAAVKVSLSIQSLDILTFEHFKKVRALCTEEQKPKFDELIQQMVRSVNSPQQGPQPAIKEGMPPAESK
jgi:Spy/CpxP family protein refolding chaperone